jgi:hypothetical protein
MTRLFVVKQLCGHVAHEDVRAKNLFHIFDILKCTRYVF